jgi:RimJ/RimL family protein N-acetyltransferase
VQSDSPQDGCSKFSQFYRILKSKFRGVIRYWGKDYAPESAQKCLELAFNQHKLAEIVSFTAAINLKSQRVMEKIGMTRDISGAFIHPNLDPSHRLNPHVLYQIKNNRI